MNAELAALIVIVLLLALLLMRTPVGIALLVSGGIGVALVDGFQNGALAAVQGLFRGTAQYTLFVIPMFIFLGTLIANAGIGERIFSAANRVVHRLPGGLAAATVLATTVFSGISGSSAADVATFGRIAAGQMRRHGYRPAYAAAIVAIAGSFAVLIPPNIGIVVYGILADQSIGALLLAGIIPGLISCAILAVVVIVRARVNPASYGDRAVPLELRTGGVDLTTTRRQDAVGLLYALVLFLLVLGGIYTGIFTSTEAGAIGAFVALVMAALVARFRPRPLARSVTKSLFETTQTTSMIFLLLVGGTVFNFFIASSGLAADLTTWVAGLPIPPLLVIGIFLILLLPLGMFLEGLTIMLVTVPLFAPVAAGLGFDGVWLGILILKMVEIGLLMPPLGINVFVIAGIVKDVKPEAIFRVTLPFVVLDLLITALFFAFPDIVLWLPRAAGLSI